MTINNNSTVKSALLVLFLLFDGVLFVVAQQSNNTADTNHLFTSFDGVKIYYEVKGTGSPIVLIHGFIVNGETWKKTALYKDLLADGYKVVTLDMRGNGHSDKPHNPEAYEHDAEAKDIMALTKMLGIKKYSVVGYSRGAIISSRLVLQDPNVTKAVIGGMGTGFTNPEWPRRKMFYRALKGDSVPELAAMVKNVQAAGLDQLALAYLQKAQPSSSPQELKRINKPVLVICGSEDEDNGSGSELSKLIPASTFATVPGNHGAAVGTQEFSREVISFLKK
ncbi:MAG: alpha/beta hydrolase [Chitinophagaceae bacterium]